MCLNGLVLRAPFDWYFESHRPTSLSIFTCDSVERAGPLFKTAYALGAARFTLPCSSSSVKVGALRAAYDGVMDFMPTLFLVHSSGPESDSGPVNDAAADESFVGLPAAYKAAVLAATAVRHVHSDLALIMIIGFAIPF